MDRTVARGGRAIAQLASGIFAHAPKGTVELSEIAIPPSRLHFGDAGGDRNGQVAIRVGAVTQFTELITPQAPKSVIGLEK